MLTFRTVRYKILLKYGRRGIKARNLREFITDKDFATTVKKLAMEGKFKTLSDFVFAFGGMNLNEGKNFNWYDYQRMLVNKGFLTQDQSDDITDSFGDDEDY